MKKLFASIVITVLTTAAFGVDPAPVEIDRFSLSGKIDGENISFEMSFDAEVNDKSRDMLLLAGDAGILAGELDSRKYRFVRRGESLFVDFLKKGAVAVAFDFATQAARQGDWRETAFMVPNATVRRISIVCDRPDLEIDFPGALKTDERRNEDGQKEVTAYLGVSDRFVVRWKPEVRKLSAAAVLSCEANTIASAGVGVLRQESVFNYQLAQGSVDRLSFQLPPDLSVTQVKGADILRWAVAEGEGDGRILTVELNRPQTGEYALTMESELVLPEFPCDFRLPMPRPLDVIRASGFLMIGTDSAIKLLIDRASGLTQIDLDSFPAARMPGGAGKLNSINKVFAYQYANMPFDLSIKTDDIVTSFSSEDRIVVDKKDDDLVLSASIELDVRDAPAREIAIETDPDWIVANVTGSNVGDYNLRDEGGMRIISVFFKQAVEGKCLLDVRLEHTLDRDQGKFEVPHFAVRDAESERGFLVLSAEKGVRFEEDMVENLREIHTKSVPVQVENTRLAYRFKNADWSLSLLVQETDPSIYCEIFHLVSLGENALYGSSSLTYHVGEAPVRKLQVKVPKGYGHVEFTGRDIRSRKQSGELWELTLQEKALGDYTLLVTYDQQFDYEGGEIVLGGVTSEGIDGETGFIALAGRASLNVKDLLSADAAIIPIDSSEIPEEYKLLINDPVLRAYKYVGLPHKLALDLQRYQTQSMLGQVAEHTTFETRISEEGEAVTKATYFVKNTSSQYLEIDLPGNARLWSVQVDGAKVQALNASRDDSGILIPLERNIDPNQPLKVVVEYAESQTPLEWRSAIGFTAPVCRAQSAFSRWTFTVPEDFSLAATGGNMMESEPVVATGMLALLRRTAFTVKHLLVWAPPFAVAAFFAWIIALQRGRGTKAIAPSVLMVLFLAGSLFVSMLAGAAFGFLPPTWGSGFLSCGAPRSVDLTKVVSLAGSGIEAELLVVPAWVGGSGGMPAMIIGVLAGVVAIAAAVFGKRRSQFVVVSGLTVLTWGMAQTLASLSIGSVALAVIPPLAIACFLAACCYRFGCRHPRPPRVKRKKTAAKSPPPKADAEASKPEAEPGAEDGAAPVPPPSPIATSVVLLLALGLLVSGSRAEARPQTDAPPQQTSARDMSAAHAEISAEQETVMDEVLMKIIAPEAVKDAERVAKVELECSIDVEEAGELKLLSAETVLLDYRLEKSGWGWTGEDDAAIESRADGYYLVLQDDGEYRLLLNAMLPVSESAGDWHMNFYLPPNLKNRVLLEIPAKGFIPESRHAVFLKSSPADDGSVTTAVFGNSRAIAMSWKPQVRKTELEDVAFFVNTRSEIVCESGVVNLDNRISYQIAQGEMQALKIKIPSGMTVTAVDAPGLSTWRFDADSQFLEAMLEKPVSQGFVLRVMTQIARERLPYDVGIRLPAIQNAEYQRGTLALAGTDNVQAIVKTSEGLHSMNINDFEQLTAEKGGARETSLKRAFRYHHLPAALTLAAEEVLPEIRVEETASVDVSSERMVLSSKLALKISKAGIFSIELDLPSGYEVETLTGANIGHWDEAAEGAGRIGVHFKKRVLGEQQINLVLVRIEKDLGSRVELPRVRVADSLKHKGVLTVSGERGVRLSTIERQGVSELNPRDLGIRIPGYLAFRILRPDWSVELKTEILDPIIKADLLQKIDLNEGVLLGRCFIRYEIDNAGCKQFRLQAPRPDLVLSILGKDIADIRKIDDEKGIWQIDLHNKVEHEYNLEVSYQLAFDPKAGKTRIEPLIPLDIASRKGYLVVMVDGRLQVLHGEVPGGLREENARSVPEHFGAGDLSDAILCYKVGAEDYALDISIIRHDSASVLPASVQSVKMDSVVSADDQIVTRVRLDMNAGDMRLLKMCLPAGSRVWSTYVNGNAVKPLSREDAHLIPLDGSSSGESTSVEIVYGGRLPEKSGRNEYAIPGPRLGLPLNNIDWSIHMPPSARYYDFDGTMQHDDAVEPLIAEYNTEFYTSTIQQEVRRNLELAEEVLSKGEQYAQAGRQRQAKLAFQSAMNYSQGDEDFNADARIQYRNIAKKQAVVGLVNRRNRLKKSINVQDAEQDRQMEGFNEGNWSADYENQIEQSLTAKDNKALNVVAEKIIGQQVAAVEESPSIRLALPASGKRLDFSRDVQINPDAEMEVVFKASGGGWKHRIHVALALAGLFLGYMIISAVGRRAMRA